MAVLLGVPTLCKWWGFYDEDRLRREFLEDSSVRAFAVEVEGELAGVVDYYEERDPDYYHAALDISMGEPHQGQGLGSDAVRTLVSFLVKKRGHHRLTVDPAADNTDAVRFYERLGFERVGTMRCYERDPGGRWRDGLLMELVLEDCEPGVRGCADIERLRRYRTVPAIPRDSADAARLSPCRATPAMGGGLDE